MNEPLVSRWGALGAGGFARICVFVLVIASAFAILSTARTFSGTVDEPAHLAAGMQWLTTGDYTYDLPHPPLGRIVIALGPYMHGARSTGAPSVYEEGARILGRGAFYVEALASARHGTIWFFFLLALGVWLWARRLTGEVGAAVAVLFLVTNPNVLAHAGLATTDMACAATTTLALFAAVWWLDEISWMRSAAFGVAIGLAISSRLSAVAFVAAPLVVCYVIRGWARDRWRLSDSVTVAQSIARLFGVALIALLFVFAIYRFSFGAFTAGLETFFVHGSSGHPTFLLGKPSNRGWWYYFPIALWVKTPLPLLLLGLVGGGACLRRLHLERDWAAAFPIVAATTILLVSMSVRVDLGVRLVLPIYPLLAIAAAQGTLALLQPSASHSAKRRSATKLAVGGLLASSMMIAVAAHPDQLAYFNLFAGDHPEHVLVDSNLDWGQDLYRLRDTVAARGIRDSVRVAYFGTADLTAAGVRKARVLGLHEHATGWIAASETFLAGEWVGPAYQWLLAYPPVARIGPSMRLWYIPDSATRDSLPRSIQ